MAHSRLVFAIYCIPLLWCIIMDIFFRRSCLIVDFERPATVSITRHSSDGAEIWGYVEVRKGAHLFWSYYKSPHRDSLSSPGKKPWSTIFYAAPAASSAHGNFNGVRPLVPRNSTWLHNADLLIVDTPVGTGNSYEEHATSGNRARTSFPEKTERQVAADILVLLTALTREIATLQGSPLILLDSTYGGTYAGMISTIVGKAIWLGALSNLTYGGLVERFDGRSMPPEQNQIVDARPRIRLADPAENNCTCTLHCTYTPRYHVC